jgi:hypothetical protein
MASGVSCPSNPVIHSDLETVYYSAYRVRSGICEVVGLLHRAAVGRWALHAVRGTHTRAARAAS